MIENYRFYQNALNNHKTIMKFDKEPVEETASTGAENDSSDFDDACEITSTSSSPKRILSSSLSSLEGEQTAGVDDSDNDSGFVGVSQGSLDRLDTVTPDVNNEIVECHEVMEPGTERKNERDAILYELATSEDRSQAKILPMIKEMLELQNGVPSKLCKYTTDDYENGKISAEELKKSNIEILRNAMETIPDSLLHLVTGRKRPGDCGRPSDQKPEWLDMDKLRRGQKFAQDHMFSVYFSELLSLFALFSFEDGLKPLIITGKSSTPYTAFRRYLSTGLRVRNWYTEDPWAKGSAARKDVLTVRAMHAAVRRRLETSTNQEIDTAAEIPNAWCPTRELLIDDFSEFCEPPLIGQCPHMLQRNDPDRPKGINQSEMALTQWGFIGLVTSYPKLLGVHYASDEDLEDFCHLWRSIGYQLGMEDKYNFCRGTLEEIRERSRDFLDKWVKPNLRIITPEWEHMMRCIFVGVGAFLPGVNYETGLLHLTEILGLPMPRLYASLSYRDWISYNLTKSLLHYSIRLPGMSSFINSRINRILDRAANFTPEELESMKIKLSDHPANYEKADESTNDN